MNKRIQELHNQARDFYLQDEYLDCSTKDLHRMVQEKFAELIIGECLMIIDDRQAMAPTDDDGYFKVALNMASKDIELHFGVEE